MMEVQTATARISQPRQSLPRLFTISYNRAKLPTRNPATRQEYQRNLSLWGTLYPATEDYPGSIVLQNGVVFTEFEELRAHFARMGSYSLADVDGNEL